MDSSVVWQVVVGNWQRSQEMGRFYVSRNDGSAGGRKWEGKKDEESYLLAVAVAAADFSGPLIFLA